MRKEQRGHKCNVLARESLQGVSRVCTFHKMQHATFSRCLLLHKEAIVLCGVSASCCIYVATL